VDLDVPEAPGQRVTIESTHLENRAKPKIRRQQIEESLNQVRDHLVGSKSEADGFASRYRLRRYSSCPSLV
jgi:hypothetical protein